MKRTMSPEQQARADERRAQFRKMAGEISRMTDAERGALAARLPVIATVEGRTLSVFNACLIATQCPSATIVGGFRQWVKAGRAVRKGEHGLSIWIPTMRKNGDEHSGEDDSAETHFFMGTVFDVAQTQEIGTAADESAEVQAAPEAGRFVFGGAINNPEIAKPQSAAQAYYSEEFTPTA